MEKYMLLVATMGIYSRESILPMAIRYVHGFGVPTVVTCGGGVTQQIRSGH